ncbi:9220_t:CDS:1 [Funneliformis mosseae]|uniref:9220_t:CDS:1 n=1 Tax=Funneliformis mosseae TaxID=27381 RepID=A0A9N8V511_FUNMO|nr:9220_t:CDS:1 [Funneliformis mosseae]
MVKGRKVVTKISNRKRPRRYRPNISIMLSVNDLNSLVSIPDTLSNNSHVNNTNSPTNTLVSNNSNTLLNPNTIPLPGNPNAQPIQLPRNPNTQPIPLTGNLNAQPTPQTGNPNAQSTTLSGIPNAQPIPLTGNPNAQPTPQSGNPNVQSTPLPGNVQNTQSGNNPIPFRTPNNNNQYMINIIERLQQQSTGNDSLDEFYNGFKF